jgi:hypothetical protein
MYLAWLDSLAFTCGAEIVGMIGRRPPEDVPLENNLSGTCPRPEPWLSLPECLVGLARQSIDYALDVLVSEAASAHAWEFVAAFTLTNVWFLHGHDSSRMW